MSEKFTVVASQFGVGAVAAVATVPPTGNQWIGLVVSCITIVLSVLLSGYVQHWLHRSAVKKEEAEASRYSEMSQGEHLKNTTRLLDLKETEIKTLMSKIDALQLEVSALREEVATLKNENAQLTLLLGAKLKDLFQVQSLKDVFDVIGQMTEGEKAGD